MKHLHLRFVAASCGFGLGGFMLLLAGWQAQALGTTALASPLLLPPTLDTLIGVILVAFGWHGVRQELASARR